GLHGHERIALLHDTGNDDAPRPREQIGALLERNRPYESPQTVQPGPDLLVEVLLVLFEGGHLTAEYEGKARQLRSVDGQMEALVGTDAAEGEHEVFFGRARFELVEWYSIGNHDHRRVPGILAALEVGYTTQERERTLG